MGLARLKGRPVYCQRSDPACHRPWTSAGALQTATVHHPPRLSSRTAGAASAHSAWVDGVSYWDQHVQITKFAQDFLAGVCSCSGVRNNPGAPMTWAKG